LGRDLYFFRRFPKVLSKNRSLIYSAILLMLGISTSCSGENIPDTVEAPMTLTLTSPAFEDSVQIPTKYTCDAEDLSPPLFWTGIPDTAKSLALICDDPDAPMKTWVHWVLYGLSPVVTGLDEGVPKSDVLPDGAMQGVTDFGRTGYGGPCPPRGKPHRYFFKLYALDAELDLKPRATKKDLLKAMEGHILAQGQLMGLYKRK
jgi:Raf kinase inhibitor-like YbhB/YbcL family protein